MYTAAAPSLQQIDNLIDGRWRPAASERRFIATSPLAPDIAMAEIADADHNDVSAAVDSAAAAAADWARQPMIERANLLRRWAEQISQRADELSELIVTEVGKPTAEARGEVSRAIEEIEVQASLPWHWAEEVLPSRRPGYEVAGRRTPIGPVAAITPWNFPVVAPVRKIAPGLVLGCPIVLKPSEHSPIAAALLGEAAVEAGFPPGVLNIVHGREAGRLLVEQEAIRGVTFTGSTQVGRHVAVTAAERLIPTQLELGGKNAAVVGPYADLATAADEIVTAAFTGAGQRCTAISRVIADRSIAAELESLLAERIGRLVIADPRTPGAQIGPLATPAQYDKVIQHLQLARREGARLVVGGRAIAPNAAPSPGGYITPTLLADVHRDSAAARQEIFGPVLSMLTVDSAAEALSVHESTGYGLAASLFCDDPEWSETITRRVRVGMIHVGHGTASETHVPFGGHGQSGAGAPSIGRTNRDFFTEWTMIYRPV